MVGQAKEIVLAGMEECAMFLVLPSRLDAFSAGSIHVEPLMHDSSNAAAVLVSLLSALVQLPPRQLDVILDGSRK